MDKNIKSTILITLLTIITSAVWAQEKQISRFGDINLKELKKRFVDELLKDDLIDNRKAEIYFKFKTGNTELNGVKLREELHLKYVKIADQFNIGRGSNRAILINSKCIAVGDFYEDYFKGKMEGRMKIANVGSSGN